MLRGWIFERSLYRSHGGCLKERDLNVDQDGVFDNLISLCIDLRRMGPN